MRERQVTEEPALPRQNQGEKEAARMKAARA
jgi:hypothetical protein